MDFTLNPWEWLVSHFSLEEALDCLTNSLCIENSMENIQTDISV